MEVTYSGIVFNLSVSDLVNVSSRGPSRTSADTLTCLCLLEFNLIELQPLVIFFIRQYFLVQQVSKYLV